MNEKQDLYTVLNVPKNCDQAEVKKAFRKLAVKFHPDKNPGNQEAEQRFKEVQQAYDVLSDPQKRSAYDQFGHAALNGGMGGGFSGQSFDMGDLFGEIFGDSPFKDFFGGSGGGGKSGSRPRRGADIQYQLDLKFEDAIFGTKTEISVPRAEECNKCGTRGAVDHDDIVTCPVCHGKGQIQRVQGVFSLSTTCHQCTGRGKVIKKPCPDCRGQGFVKRSSKLSVSVPAGVDDGVRIKLRREGEPGRNGGPHGDLYLLLRVQEHEFFERDGIHIILRQKISFTQAALGCSMKIPTLNGSVKLSVPEATQSGQIFRIRGEGVPDVHGGGRKGDQMVEIIVETPKNLDSKQKELLKELADLRGEELVEADFLDRMTEKVKDFFG